MLENYKWSQYNLIVQSDEEGYLLYNSLSRSFIQVALDKGRSIDFNSSPNTSINDPSALRQLYELGFITLQEVDESLLAKSLLFSSRFDKTGLGLFVAFASDCNFSCGYCYQSSRFSEKGKQSRLSEDYWKRILRFLEHRIAQGTRSITLTCYGGEPLLNFRVLRQSLNDVRELEQRTNISLTVGVITNGSPLVAKRIQELLKYLDWIQITLDGPPNVHNERRPLANGLPSFSAVQKGLFALLDSSVPSIALRINVDEKSWQNIVDFLPDLHRWFSSDELKKITLSFSWLFPTQEKIPQWFREGENFDSISMDPRIHSGYLEKILTLQRTALELGFKVDTSFVSGPCPILSASALTIDHELKVYKCPGYIYQYPVGYIDEDGSLKILSNFWFEATLSEPSCNYMQCEYGPICYGGCRWMAGGLNNVSCMKNARQELLDEMLKIHAKAIIAGQPEEE